MLPEDTKSTKVYAFFRAINEISASRFQGDLGGRLLLAGALDESGANLILAANIAGAASLSIDADIERGRHGIRNGVCDFLVNTLDEALRILKNEIRKKQTVSVCLSGEWNVLLAETLERGVQPDLLAIPIPSLVERGAAVVPLVENETQRRLWERTVTWTVNNEPARWLPRLDALAAAALTEQENDPRLRWLRLAPRYLRRALAANRHVDMSEAEADRFEASVDEQRVSGELPASVRVVREP